MSEMGPRILVVEDDADEAQLLRMILEPEGYEVIIASNGREGLQRAEQDDPDLIILDIMMPELDGFSMCSKLRELPRHSATPVVLLTGVSQRIHDTKYPLNGVLRAEAQEYLEKPIEPERLLQVVGRLLS